MGILIVLIIGYFIWVCFKKEDVIVVRVPYEEDKPTQTIWVPENYKQEKEVEVVVEIKEKTYKEKKADIIYNPKSTYFQVCKALWGIGIK